MVASESNQFNQNKIRQFINFVGGQFCFPGGNKNTKQKVNKVKYTYEYIIILDVLLANTYKKIIKYVDN